MRVNRIILVLLALSLNSLVVGETRSTHALSSGRDIVHEAVVYPSGDPDIDVARVQAAVDSAESVLLKAADELGVPTPFNFGENTPSGGFVVLEHDVVLGGEMLGSYRTTIVGGFAPLRSVASNPVSSSISGINFASPGVAALFVTGATGVEFVDNHVQDVVGLADWIPGVSKGQGVWVVGLETVTGEILIADNLIEGVDAQTGYGLALFGFSADARIERNDIRGVDTAGILVGVHTGQVWITDNQIAPGPPKYETPYGHGTGVIVGDALGGSTYLRDNTIECVNPLAAGILVAASRTLGEIQDHAVIEGNRVIMHGSITATAIALIGSVSNTLVAHNRLEGKAAFAFEAGVWFTPGDTVESNTFIGNNVSRFESSIADVAFDVNTRNNLVVGRATGVIDLGVDNWISGTSRGQPPLPPGQQLSSNRNHLSLTNEGLVPSSLTE